jgi:glyoxylase-like metal-dependent hydrolase (beta-lactamase superfamily II)
LPFGDWELLVASIRLLANRFPADTVVYPGHGPTTTLGDELVHNPFLAELRAS